MNGYIISQFHPVQMALYSPRQSILVGGNFTKSKTTQKWREGGARKGNPKVGLVFQNEKQSLLYSKEGVSVNTRKPLAEEWSAHIYFGLCMYQDFKIVILVLLLMSMAEK